MISQLQKRLKRYRHEGSLESGDSSTGSQLGSSNVSTSVTDVNSKNSSNFSASPNEAINSNLISFSSNKQISNLNVTNSKQFQQRQLPTRKDHTLRSIIIPNKKFKKEKEFMEVMKDRKKKDRSSVRLQSYMDMLLLHIPPNDVRRKILSNQCDILVLAMYKQNGSEIMDRLEYNGESNVEKDEKKDVGGDDDNGDDDDDERELDNLSEQKIIDEDVGQVAGGVEIIRTTRRRQFSVYLNELKLNNDDEFYRKIENLLFIIKKHSYQHVNFISLTKDISTLCYFLTSKMSNFLLDLNELNTQRNMLEKIFSLLVQELKHSTGMIQDEPIEKLQRLLQLLPMIEQVLPHRPNIEDYSVFIALSFRVQFIFFAVQFMKRATGKYFDPQQKIRLHQQIIRGFIELKMIREAMVWYHDMKRMYTLIPRSVIVPLISMLSDLDPSKAKEVVIEMEDIYSHEIDPQCYNKLISFFCKNQQLDEAYTLFERMINRDSKPIYQTFEILIRSTAYHDIDRAIHVFNRLKNDKNALISISQQTIECMIDGYVKNDQDEKAEVLFAMLKNHPHNNYKSYVKNVSIPRIREETGKIFVKQMENKKNKKHEQKDYIISKLKTAFNNSDRDSAIHLFKQLIFSGHRPTETQVNKLFTIFHKVHDVTTMRELFLILKEIKQSIPLKIYNMLIDSSLKRFDVKDAVMYFVLLCQDGLKPDLYTFTSLVDGFSKSYMLHVAERTFLQAKRQNISFDIRMAVPLLRLYAYYGMEKQIESLASSMKGKGIALNIFAFTSIIEGFSAQGHMDHAVKYVKKMKQAGIQPDAYVYHALLTGYGSAANLSKLEETFKEFQESGQKISTITYNIMIGEYLRLFKYEEAWKCIDEMKSKLIKPNARTFSIFVNHFSKTNDLEKAYHSLDRMKQEGVKPNSFVYSPLVKTLAEKGYVREIEAVISRMKQEGLKPNAGIYQLYDYAKDLSTIIPKKRFNKKIPEATD